MADALVPKTQFERTVETLQSQGCDVTRTDNTVKVTQQGTHVMSANRTIDGDWRVNENSRANVKWHP